MECYCTRCGKELEGVYCIYIKCDSKIPQASNDTAVVSHDVELKVLTVDKYFPRNGYNPFHLDMRRCTLNNKALPWYDPTTMFYTNIK